MVDMGRFFRTLVRSDKMWRVILWVTDEDNDSFDVETKEDAYILADKYAHVYSIEIYGPDGFYDGVQ
jgi:hypothetical protein